MYVLIIIEMNQAHQERTKQVNEPHSMLCKQNRTFIKQVLFEGCQQGIDKIIQNRSFTAENISNCRTRQHGRTDPTIREKPGIRV